MNKSRRFTPALALLVIAPLIAEFLLADFNIRQLAYLGIFIPLYGAGALMIRECARRSGRGWPSMLLMALAYGVTLEGIINQTLFNPDYAGQHMLAYGFIPSLGTSFNYGIYIVTLHTVWSISSPIALAEALAGPRWREPWLGRAGFVVTILLSLLGLTGTTVSTIKRYHFIASPAQYASALTVILALVVGAFVFCRPTKRSPSGDDTLPQRPASHLWAILAVSFILSSTFQLWFHLAPGDKFPAWLGVLVFLLLDLTAITCLVQTSRRLGWGPTRSLAAAMGAILTYGWFGLRRYLVFGGTAMGVHTKPIDIVGELAILLGLLALGWWSKRRLDRSTETDIRS